MSGAAVTTFQVRTLPSIVVTVRRTGDSTIAGHFFQLQLETSAFNGHAWFGFAATATLCWSVSLTCRCRSVMPEHCEK